MAIAESRISSTMTPRTGLMTHRQWPVPNRSWFMRMNWHDLLFMHWPVAAESLQQWLPERVEVDLFEGQAWIGIVPFRMSGVAPRFFPNLPWLSAFPELNVRTYVTVDNKPGVWFFSLDATNPVAVRAARYLFHLKYMDAQIRSTRQNSWFHYFSSRTHRNEPPAELEVEYRPIGESFSSTPGQLDHWLTARYCLYTADRRGRIFRGEIDHNPWELFDAQAIIHRNTMLSGLNVELPDSPPLLHFARQTSVIAWANQVVE